MPIRRVRNTTTKQASRSAGIKKEAGKNRPLLFADEWQFVVIINGTLFPNRGGA